MRIPIRKNHSLNLYIINHGLKRSGLKLHITHNLEENLRFKRYIVIRLRLLRTTISTYTINHGF